MSRSKKLIRKIVAGAIGFPLLIVGIVLIPLPGPGLLVCFLALLVLSQEFEWAERRADQVKAQLKKIKDKTTNKIKDFEEKEKKKF